MLNEKGSLSINSENILPIIKKWLYSDTDIFLRELVSNGSDAINKLIKLDAAGEADIPADEKFYVRVTLDKDAGTIVIADNGIGMTADEIKKYINQIAFSGASDFIDKYKDKMEAGSDIIGHFGLGFYSAFMTSKMVQIDTKSFLEGESAVKWTSDGGTGFEMTESGKTDRGTEITLYINDDSKEFLDEFRLRGILKKYCSFMPVDIFFTASVEEEGLDSGECDCEHDHEDGEDCKMAAPAPINDKNPLWNKKPSEVTDEEYKTFYHKAFTDWGDPLFWIHLNMDYPFRLKGILYFPKLSHELESIEGQVKLYNNQVFIAENIKEVIPEFLLLLKGVMDCPDLPLNVSRSALQNDGYVAKMSAYITKKVADKLTGLFNDDREQYNKFWDDINPFIKYGCIKENDFYEKVKPAILFKTAKDEYLTIQEYYDRNEEKAGKQIIYVTNVRQQAQYLMLTDEQGLDAVVMDARIDNPFMSYIESYEREQKVKFIRIDSDLSSVLKDESSGDQIDDDAMCDMFKEATRNDKLSIRIEGLKNTSVPAIIILSEESRRMQEMSKMFGGMNASVPDAFESKETLVLNSRNSLVKTLYELRKDEGRKADVRLICEHMYDLAMMSHRQLLADDMNRFIARSGSIMERLMTDGGESDAEASGEE